ncbi:hypothetical protein GOODEAATRI_034619, partial [Goodea atripinnis]
VVGNASLVCGGVPCQREEWCHHVRPFGHRDPEGDWNQQPPAQAQTSSGHPGDGLPHQPLGPTHHQN